MRNRDVVVGWLHGFIAAFQFLTRLPVPVQIAYTEQVFRRSVVFYPLAGAVIGLLLAGAGAGLRLALPAFPAAVLLLALWVILTGGLHLDGLMDTADGILSHRPREQMLEIMKDSRVGAMGVIVCVLHLLLKLSLLYTLLDVPSAGVRLTGGMLLAIIPIWSRWFMAAAIYGWPYARRESGLGSLFQGVGRKDVAMCTAAALLATSLTVLAVHASAAPASEYLNVWTITAGFALGTFIAGCSIAGYISRKLGGLTGDTYGALNELLEALLLLAAAAVFIHI